jgi:hypothetical protein
MHVVCVQRCGAEQRRLVRTNALDASAGDSPLASHSSIAFPDALGAFPSLSSGYNLAFRVFTSRPTLQASPPPLDSCADMDVHKEGECFRGQMPLLLTVFLFLASSGPAAKKQQTGTTLELNGLTR